MTCPLVKPAAGYITFCRLERLSCFPWISTCEVCRAMAYIEDAISAGSRQVAPAGGQSCCLEFWAGPSQHRVAGRHPIAGEVLAREAAAGELIEAAGLPRRTGRPVPRCSTPAQRMGDSLRGFGSIRIARTHRHM